MKIKNKSGGKVKRSKPKRSVDAWDTGKAERKRNEQASSSSSNKRLQFDPKPPTFVAATRTEMLTQRMGHFAGPLLGALWNEQEDEEDGIIIRTRKPEPEVKNTFSGLALSSSSSDDDEVEEEEPNPFAVKPSTFANTSSVGWMFTNNTAAAADPWKLKEPTFKLEEATTKANKPEEIIFKPASFVLPTAQDEFSDDDDL